MEYTITDAIAVAGILLSLGTIYVLPWYSRRHKVK